MARKKLPEIIDRQEAELLFNQINPRYIRGKRNLAIFKLILNSGLRVSEVCSLKNKDVDFKKNVISVIEGKGGKDRLVPFPDDLKSYLMAWMDEKNKRGIISKYFFCSYSKGTEGKKLSPRYLQLALKQYGIKAGINKKLHPHMLRHTYATTIYTASKHNLEGLRQLLGHASIQTTQIYITLSMADLKEAITDFKPF